MAIELPGAGGRGTTVTSDGTVELWRVRIFARDGFIQYLRMHETVSIALKSKRSSNLFGYAIRSLNP